MKTFSFEQKTFVLEQNTSFLKQNKTPLRPEHRKWIPNLKNPSLDPFRCRRGMASCLIFRQGFLEIGQWRHKVTVGTIEANNRPGRSPALRHEKPKQRGVVWDGRLGGRARSDAPSPFQNCSSGCQSAHYSGRRRWSELTFAATGENFIAAREHKEHMDCLRFMCSLRPIVFRVVRVFRG